MILVGLVGAAPDLEQSVGHVTSRDHLSLPGLLDVSPAALLARIEGPVPQILILDSRGNPQSALSLAEQFTAQHPDIVILLATDDAAALSLPAMRAGVRDVITVQEGVDDVTRALNTASAFIASTQSASAQASRYSANRMVTVISPKGGVGKTTVATNVAVALARTLPNSTVLVDLDLQFGDVSTALNLTPEFSLVDALPSVANNDSISLKSYLSLHKTGLYVLPAPDHPAGADAVTGTQVGNLLRMLATEFPFVVVDTSPGLSDHTLAALDHTTDPILLTTLSVTGVRGMRKVVDTLGQMQMFSDRHKVVLNFSDNGHGLTKEDAEATLRVPVHTSLPTSKAAPASINLGVPLVQSNTRDPLVKALSPLVQGYLPADVELNLRGRHRRLRRSS